MSTLKNIKDAIKAQISAALGAEFAIFAGVPIDAENLRLYDKFAVIYFSGSTSDDTEEIGADTITPQMETWRWIIALGVAAADELDDAIDVIDPAWVSLRDGLQGYDLRVVDSNAFSISMTEPYEPMGTHPSGIGMVVAVRLKHEYWSCP